MGRLGGSGPDSRPSDPKAGGGEWQPGRGWAGRNVGRRSLARALSLLLTAGVVALPFPLRADHIPSAQEGLGPTWWGVLLMGLTAMGFVAAILVAVRSLLRAEAERATE